MATSIGNIKNVHMGSNIDTPERFDIRYQLYVLLFKEIEQAVMALDEKKFSAAKYKLTVDQLYYFIKLMVKQVKNKDEIIKLKSDLDKKIMHIHNFQECYNYIIEVQEYYDLILDNVKQTGLLRPRDGAGIAGHGLVDEEEAVIPDINFPKPRVKER